VGGTPVPKNSILVVGGTGTLGRQVVRKALDEGYEVRCIVKPRNNPADFLRDWGATTVQVRRPACGMCAPVERSGSGQEPVDCSSSCCLLSLLRTLLPFS
jgi:NAD(P)-dependent dehydrogenase (short-subunit alcohol dehydrogenase family)